MNSICLDARKLEIGGIGTYLQNLLKNFSTTSLDISLLVPSQCSIDLEGFRLIACDTPDYSIREQFKLPFIVPKCDLFWTPHFNVPLFPIRAKKRLITLPDIFHLACPSGLKFLERKYSKLFISRAVDKCDHIITVSEFSKSEILRLTSAKEEKVSVIPNGVDQELFSHSERNSTIKVPETYFLFVGNQKSHKNLRGALQGFDAFLSKSQSDSYLLVVGSGEGLRHVVDLQRLLKNFPRLKNRVISLGRVALKDLPSLYQRAVALVFPSLYEGFGLPPLEAMSCACPAIVSRAASLEEICKDAVYYIDPMNALSIAGAMEALWKDFPLRQNLIEKGREHVKAFLWKTAAERHLEIIEELLV